MSRTRPVPSGAVPIITYPAVPITTYPPRLPAQLVRFAAIGVVSTLAYSVLFLALRPWGAQSANVLALLATAVANTAANRRFTFAATGRDGAVRHHAQGLVVFATGLAVTSGALALLQLSDPQPGRAVELVVLAAANLTATVLRFVLLRGWVFRSTR